MAFKKIDPNTLTFNPFTITSKDWFLITAGETDHYNTMTGGWGTLGFIWNRPLVNIFVRDHRYTHEFVENNDLFTVCFFDETHRKALSFCGSKSGRDYADKAKECGLTAFELEGTTAFEEANLIFVCKKIYKYRIKPEEMIESNIEDSYPLKDYHDCYFGEIIAAYVPE